MVRRTRCPGGFTLIELLVALSVMAVLAVLGSRALDGMTRAQAQLQQRADQVLALQAGLGQWEADLAAVYETRRVSALDFDGRALRLTRRDVFQPDALRVVAWSQRSLGGQLRWLRWQSPPLMTRGELDTAWLQAAAWAQNPDDAARRAEVTIADIERWQIYFYRGDAWTNPLSTAISGGTANTVTPGSPALGDVPDGVRLELTLASGQALSGRITRDWVRPVLGGSKS
jgi:general secretion pathway protein J